MASVNDTPPNSGPGEIPLIPVASPADTFVRQPQPVRNPLADLATSLSTLDSGLRDYMAQSQNLANERDKIAGHAAFYTANQQGFNDAVAAGTIPAQASPMFMAAYKKEQGNVAGYELQQKYSAAYDAWPGKNAVNQDPQALTKFTTAFISQNLGQNTDPAVMRGLQPHLEQIIAQGSAKYVADQHKALTEGLDNTAASTLSNTINSAITTGYATTGTPDYAAMTAGLLDVRARLQAAGRPPEEADKFIAETVKAEALRNQDPQILTTFYGTPIPGAAPGPDGTVPTFGSRYRLHQVEAEKHVEEAVRIANHEASAAQKLQDEAALKATKMTIIESIVAHPDAAVDPALIARAEKLGDPEARIHIQEWQAKLREGLPTDPQLKFDLTTGVLHGSGMDPVYAAGGAVHAKDLENLYNLDKTVKAGADQTPTILNNEAARNARANIRLRFPMKEGMDAAIAGIGGTSDPGQHATDDFDLMLVQWSAAHPRAGALETQRAIIEARDAVQAGAGPADLGVERTYTSPIGVDLQGPPPATPSARQGATMAPGATGAVAPPASPGQSPLGSAATPAPATPSLAPATPPTGAQIKAEQAALWDWFSAQPPAQQAAITKAAADKGMPVYDLMRQLRARATTPQPGAAASPTPEPPIASGGMDPRSEGDSGGGGTWQPSPAAIATPPSAAAPGATAGPLPATASPAALAAPPPGGTFGMAGGDSIAAQQIRHGVPGSEGKMGTPSPGMTAVVGDSPQKVLDRMQTIDPSTFAGKSIFWSPGTSNNPGQVALVSQQLDLLKAAGAAHVVVPGVGPGVANSASVNAQLKAITEAHGFTFFQPDVKWQRDGVHPAEVDKVRQQGLDAMRTSSQAVENATPQAKQAAAAILAEPEEPWKPLARTEISQIIAQALHATPASLRPGASFSLASIKDDPKAAHILDFVSEHESKGNYNAVIGNAHATQDLSQMTVSEVYALQRELVSSGRPSSAIGRYQIIGSTLRGLIGQLGVDPTTQKFTPAFQDQLGMALLKTRGYDRWQRGELTDDAFASNLSREWAALPDPERGGLSHYQGDKAGNRAGTNLAHVRALLASGRDWLFGQQPPPPAT